VTMDQQLGKRIIALRNQIVAHFDAGNWEEVGLLAEVSERINRHPRLLRSLYWSDEDYAGNVLTVLRGIAESDPAAFRIIEQYVNDRFDDGAEYVSAKPADRRILFAPHVFQVPDVALEDDLVAVMMPMKAEFDAIYNTIRTSCSESGFRCLRADDIWDESVIIQDIFNLVFRAHAVVVDFTQKNPNVMYETGIAHTLGKHVIPITQSLDDVPFDLRHHRVLKYLPNAEGLATLTTSLAKRLRHVGAS